MAASSAAKAPRRRSCSSSRRCCCLAQSSFTASAFTTAAACTHTPPSARGWTGNTMQGLRAAAHRQRGCSESARNSAKLQAHHASQQAASRAPVLPCTMATVKGGITCASLSAVSSCWVCCSCSSSIFMREASACAACAVACLCTHHQARVAGQSLAGGQDAQQLHACDP
jgi:hypothetical protein